MTATVPEGEGAAFDDVFPPMPAHIDVNRDHKRRSAMTSIDPLLDDAKQSRRRST